MKRSVLIILILLLAASIGFNVYHCLPKSSGVTSDTVRKVFVDTVLYYKPVPKDSLVSRFITRRLPVVGDTVPKISENSRETAESVPDSRDSVGHCCKSVPDSADVSIPIMQKVYEDSLYTAYISGFNPSLDSLVLRIPRTVTTITNTVLPKQSRWSIGLQVGYGINLSPTPRYSPYIGIGVQYTLFRF